jgi:SAM-dependent methyltransferase
MTTSKEKLIELYSNKSKHSNYQILPTKLKEILVQDDIQTTTRSEPERLKYILNKIDFNNKSVIDIGANTGYFSLELLDAGAKSMHYYEGNKEHVEFVRLAADILGLGSKMQITNGYFKFDGSFESRYDIGLLFNVLHHVGDDYGDKSASMEEAKRLIIKQLNNMSAVVGTLVYQMGFNWQGDISKGLFPGGTKQEMIDFVRNGIDGYWQIESIGIAERTNGQVTYEDLSNTNVERDNSMGEFLNRPIFILKSITKQ